MKISSSGVLWLPDIYRACLQRGADCKLTIVGDGPDAQQLRLRLSELGLLERSRFLQGLTHHQVYDLLLEAHVLLMPSFYEGLPIALLESMACGCVPVVSRLPGITDRGDAALQIFRQIQIRLADGGLIVGFALQRPGHVQDRLRTVLLDLRVEFPSVLEHGLALE